MIKAKPRSKPGKGGDSDAPSKSAGGGGGGGGAPSSSSAAASKKRRPSQKKKEENADAPSSLSSSATKKRSGALLSIQTLHQEEHRRYYQRAPRLLPDIDGVQALSSSEIQSDLKRLTSSLAAFEAKLHPLLPPGASPLGGGVYLHGNKQSASLSMEDAYAFMFQKRRARANGVITPEEVVETLPVCRRAVRITQRELAAMKRERDDLERDFMRQRCKLLWQLGEMKRIQKQQDKVRRVLSQNVVRKAKALESSRRRTNALQDIMTELDARGETILRLTRDKQQLEAQLRKHDLPLPEPEDMYIGDRVNSPFGKGHVLGMDDANRIVTISLEWGATAFVQEEHVDVLPSAVTYEETEKELKSKLFDKIGALVQQNGKLGVLGGGGGGRGGGSSGRRRSRADTHDDSDDGMRGREDNNEENEDDEEEGEEDDDLDDSDDEDQSSDRDDVDDRRSSSKKRKLNMVMPASSSRKKTKHTKVLDFTAGKLPITPFDSGLLISPLSVLPERVAAAAPQDLQWMSSYLPSKMVEWEQERYASLQMQGEIERLRFELQQAHAEKEDAQALAIEHVDSINDLVRQTEKLREQWNKDKDKEKDQSSSSNSSTGTASTAANGGGDVCPTCSSNSSPASTKKTASTGNAAAARTAKPNSRNAKATTRRQRSDSIGAADDGDEDADEKNADEEPQEDTAAAQDDDEYGDDGGESSDNSRPATRSLRPRRASSAASDKPASSSSASTSGAAASSNGPSKSSK